MHSTDGDFYVYDVGLCGNTVRNVALSFWLVGQPWIRAHKRFHKISNNQCRRSEKTFQVRSLSKG